MAARVLIDWDPATDSGFRRALSHALDALLIDHADAADIDGDPDGPAPMRIAVTTPSGRIVRRDADLVILTGDAGAIQLPTGALALSAGDFDPPHRRWIAVASRIGGKLGRSGLGDFVQGGADAAARAAWALAFPSDPLAADLAVSHAPAVLHEQLAAATSRAEAAERALQSAGMSESDAVRQMRRAEAASAAARAEIARLERDVQRLNHVAETSAFALSSVPESLRAAVTEAREHAWRARLAAADAMKAAQAYRDALVWPKSGASYSGETMNRRPHGHGVMTFVRGGEIIASFSGQFDHGRRMGHGVGQTTDQTTGWTWTGQWMDEAAGFGLLETSDGRRFEGEASPGEDGSPRAGAGHRWPGLATARDARRPVYEPARPALPSS